MPPAARPFRALEAWALQYGQSSDSGDSLLSHLAGPAWAAIDSFFRTHTKLGHERIQPLSRSAWYYDGSLYPMNLGVILGGAGPSTTINAFACLAKGMPASLLEEFSRDEPQAKVYLDHFSNAMDSLHHSHRIEAGLKSAFARNFLISAERHLESAVTDLLSTPPNTLAAGHARLALESALKGLLAEAAGLTEDEARKISHHLDQLISKVVAKCGRLIQHSDLVRLINIGSDCALPEKARQLFPDVGARYSETTLPARRLWQCYAAAQHAFATVLRVLGASDSRQLNP